MSDRIGSELGQYDLSWPFCLLVPEQQYLERSGSGSGRGPEVGSGKDIYGPMIASWKL
jgi:hypothetical protein